MTVTSIVSASIFVAAALICLGFAVALAFEALAIATGKEPTISSLSASAIASHPHVALLATLGVGVLLGALATHFTNWRPLP
jgi:cytochrome c oxidase assembly factor CtaG